MPSTCRLVSLSTEFRCCSRLCFIMSRSTAGCKSFFAKNPAPLTATSSDTCCCQSELGRGQRARGRLVPNQSFRSASHAQTSSRTFRRKRFKPNCSAEKTHADVCCKCESRIMSQISDQRPGSGRITHPDLDEDFSRGLSKKKQRCRLQLMVPEIFAACLCVPRLC